MERTELVQTVKNLIAAPSCCQELKAAGKKWLDSIGSAGENAAWAALVAEVKEDVCSIDDALAFFESERGMQFFGAEKAKALAVHARDRKTQGEKWCDCPACAAGVKILKSIE